MRPIMPGALLAALLLVGNTFAASPVKAGDRGYGYGGHSHVSYSSSCCYKKVVKKVVTYKRVRRHYDSGYGDRYADYGRPHPYPAYRYSDYAGRPYSRPYRYDGHGYARRPKYRSYRYSDYDGYGRRPYRHSRYRYGEPVYGPDRYYDDGAYRRPYRSYRSRYDGDLYD